MCQPSFTFDSLKRTSSYMKRKAEMMPMPLSVLVIQDVQQDKCHITRLFDVRAHQAGLDCKG